MRFQIQTKSLNTCLRLLLRHQLETHSFDTFCAVRTKIRINVSKMLVDRSVPLEFFLLVLLENVCLFIFRSLDSVRLESKM